MPTLKECYSTFISSPGDVPTERKIALKTINDITNSCRDTLGLTLDAKMWEILPPVSPQLPGEGIQDLINKEVARCDIFVLILNKRYGSAERGRKRGNTERELKTILKCLKRNKHIKLLSYLRRLRAEPDPGPQRRQAVNFRNRILHKGIWFRLYNDPVSFKDLLTHDLYNVILKMKLSPFKLGCLRQFWQFGSAEHLARPRVAVLYPPMPREKLASRGDKKFWLTRLVPALYFEDHQAIAEIQKTLGVLGSCDCTVYTQSDPVPDVETMNRVWICVPRHKAALDHLHRYKSPVRRFDITPRTKKHQATILWRTRGGRVVTIESPMAKYLKLQRKTMDISGEWNHQLGQIVARDYAILARFRDQSRAEHLSGGYLQDYFFAGIRGLGTWGAAAFVETGYKALGGFEQDEDIQLLLEVTFVDKQVTEVRDVSGEPEGYFKKQIGLDQIRRTIRQLRP